MVFVAAAVTTFDSSAKKQTCIEALVALREPCADCGANVKWPMIS
jgi:hypothetical protein